MVKEILEGEILGPEPDREKIASDERRVRSGFWSTFRKAAKRIPFIEDLVASYYCALDPQTPTRARAVLLAALAYFVMPVDWIPDFIVGFGFTDDVAVLWAAIGAIRANLKPGHYSAARDALAENGGDGAKFDERKAA